MILRDVTATTNGGVYV